MRNRQPEDPVGEEKEHWAVSTCETLFYVTVLLMLWQLGATAYKGFSLVQQMGLSEEVARAIVITMAISAVRGLLVGGGSYLVRRSARANPTGGKGVLSIILTLVAVFWALPNL